MSSAGSNNQGKPALSINDRIVWISDNGPEYGNVKWLGKLPDLSNDWMAGVEFDNPVGSGTGLYKDRQLFETELNHASLVPIIGLLKASDFHDDKPRRNYTESVDKLSAAFKRTDINESHPPAESSSLLPYPSFVVDGTEKNSLSSLTGKSKGIQGHNNSCYLDATLFSMFASTTLFDSLLYRPPNDNDIPEYRDIQSILRDEIVRPLRTDRFVSADQVMLFRTMLERSSTVDGLTDQEKDPEEFLTLLLGQILRAEPYLKLSSDLESFFYQLIVDKDETIVLPTIQDLLEQSFINSTVRLREIPPCLLLQMPRFGRQYKMYSRIMPTLRLDLTDIMESAPRACGHRLKDCDNIARYECKSCFNERSGRHNARLSSITYCANCFQAKHFGKSHSTGIEDHDKTKTVLEKTSPEAVMRYSNKISHIKDKQIPRIYMDLFAVLCIETSHYVCFVKCGQDPDATWCFFDSMADRRGEQNGYNIPEVLHFDEFSFWTSDKGATYLLNNRDDKLLPEMAKRLVCDAYLCFYQYSGLKTYR